MSATESSLIHSCCDAQNHQYTITYKIGKKEYTSNICISCINYEVRSETDSNRILKPFQRNIVKIICNTCHTDVTKTLGCDSCHSKNLQGTNN